LGRTALRCGYLRDRDEDEDESEHLLQKEDEVLVSEVMKDAEVETLVLHDVVGDGDEFRSDLVFFLKKSDQRFVVQALYALVAFGH
jgi:hypothetical protein